jgi:hypothetical protein
MTNDRFDVDVLVNLHMIRKRHRDFKPEYQRVKLPSHVGRPEFIANLDPPVFPDRTFASRHLHIDHHETHKADIRAIRFNVD